MNARHSASVATCLWILAAVSVGAESPVVMESTRQVPVAYQVDVVVVGGSTGAVSAAAAAAKAGAKVFLAAPYPYLGDDMTATLRLWLQEGEEPTSPLGKRIFSDKATGPSPALLGRSLKFSYEADQPSAARHKDTRPPSVLIDRKFGDPAKESVEYGADIRITADLHKPQEIAEVRILAYRRSGQAGFDVESVAVQTSDDKKAWRDGGPAHIDRQHDDFVIATAKLAAQARYVRLTIKKPANVDRVLLGEIEIVGQVSNLPTLAPHAKAKPGPGELKLPPDAHSGREGPVPAIETVRKMAYPPPRPLHVKKVLDETLLEAGVPFLYSCYATDVLRDASGKPCGIVMANRAGRQAVVAKVIIDATDRAWVARMAGAKFRPARDVAREVRFVVIGGQPRANERIRIKALEPPFHGPYPNRAKTRSGEFPIWKCEFTCPASSFKADDFADWAALEQVVRDLTYDAEQQFTADALFEIPPDPLEGRRSAKSPPQGAGDLPLSAFQPADVPRVYILGGRADVSRKQAEELLRPLALIDLGERIGRAAAEEAKSLPAPADVKVGQVSNLSSAYAENVSRAAKTESLPAPRLVAGQVENLSYDVRETLIGVRPTQKLPTVRQEARPLPVWGRYDVVVVGGGTSGAAAGIGAARRGAKTLVIEALHGLGGVGTLGAISNYCVGNRVGFTATVGGGNTWVIEQKMEWWRRELRKAKADIWFGAIACGAVVQDDQVRGVLVAAPQGRGAVLAKVVIDATGNADVAAAAGAKCMYTDASELAMQGTGLPYRNLGGAYTNTDFTITDDTDLVDVWHVLVYAKNKYPDAFDQGRLVDTRERRCVVGECVQTILDQVNRRTYPDTICQAKGGAYDTHGYTVDPYLIGAHPNTGSLIVNIPYRCLLPKGLEGLLVTGLGLSAHRDALPLVRMQPDVQNLGYATGVAGAMAAQKGTLVRNIDVRELQKHLVEIGNLKPEVLKQDDSYPISSEKLAAAVEDLKKNREAAAPLFAQPAQAVPLLRNAYAQAAEKDKLNYAFVLAVMGDATGLETLIREVRGAPKWDDGWNYKGMGQFGNALSPLDTLLVALGRTRDRRAVPVILEKLELLTAADAFSHHRAVGLALETIGDPDAAKPLARLLARRGMAGHVHPTIEVAIQRETPGGTNAEQTRRESIRELLLARALLRCGDHQGLGTKTLEAYTRDLRGHLARHAQAVLDAASGAGPRK